MKLSVIIVVSGNDIERFVNLLELLKCIKRQGYSPYEVILVEQSLDGFFYYNQIAGINSLKYIQIKHDVFNLSWCRNVGIYNATGDFVNVHDVDLIFDCDYLLAVSNCNIKTWAIAWKRFYYISPIEKLQYIQDQLFPNNHSDIRDAGLKIFSGGIHFFNRHWFIENLVGYSEDMFEWGKEDNDIMIRSHLITGEENIIDYMVYHLYHRTRQNDRLKNSEILYKNIENPIQTAELMRKYGVGNSEHPTLIYGDR